MLRFEIKKIFSKTVNKGMILCLLAALLVISFWTVNSVFYVDEEGNSTTGIAAVKKLRDAKNQSAGYLTADVLAKIVTENAAISNSEDYLSKDMQKQDKAYAKTQKFIDIKELVSSGFSKFKEFDYYRVDSVPPEQAGDLYAQRISNLKNWLDTGEEEFSNEEKQFLISQYEKLETPFYYESITGWDCLFPHISTVILLVALVASVLIAGIFSEEFRLKSDSVFFSSRLGRNKAAWSKIAAGFLVVTAVYWISVLFYSTIVLTIMGLDGANCSIQITQWESVYNITYFQEYLLIVLGGYVGSLFAMGVTMLVSAKSRSSMVAAVMPFVVLCFLPFLSRVVPLPQVCALFPDRLLQMFIAIKEFELFQIGGTVMEAGSILIPGYMIFSAVLIPVVYHVFRRAEIR